ncbi:hypothetical protein JCM16358_24000 [Halanaerocella petrolearia]
MHPNPEQALCDGQQSLTFKEFSNLIVDLTKMSKILNKKLVI